MFKKIVSFGLICSLFILHASDNESDTSLLEGVEFLQEDYDSDDSQSSPSSLRAALPKVPAVSYDLTTSSVTKPVVKADELQAIKERQMAVVASEPKKTAIGTVATIYTQLGQHYIYGAQVYKKIAFDEFFKQFPDEIQGFMQQTQVVSSLHKDLSDDLYDWIESSESRTEFGQYKIIGEMPSRDGFRENLFDVDFAKKNLEALTKNYIDHNYAQVREKCVKKGLATTTSQEVWSPCICGVQLHRSCFKQCNQNNVSSCVNPYCQTPQINPNSPTSWTPAIYKRAFKRPPVVEALRVKDESCSICQEPLRSPGVIATLAAHQAVSMNLRPKVSAASADEACATSSFVHKKKRPRDKSRIEEL
jgi:hypothetical protein